MNHLTILLILGYYLSFVTTGLFLAIKVQKRNLIPKEFLYIASIAISLAITYLLFYVYCINTTLGHIGLVIYLIGSGVLFIFLIQELINNKKYIKNVKSFFIVPLVIVLAFLFLYSHLVYSCRPQTPVIDQWGEVQNQTYCQIAFLPIDNALPFIYAQNVFNNHIHSLVIDWSIADRPPLQIGAALPIVDIGKNLSQYNKYTAYNLFSIFLQLSWVGLMWGVFSQLIKKRLFIWGLIVGFGSVGFFFINSVFVWPKLLSASLMTLGIYLLLNLTKNKKYIFDYQYVIFALFAIALGLLAHQGVIFTLAAVILIILYEVLFKRKLLNFNYKEAAIGVIIAVALLLPWQIIVSQLTTNNRLVKWQFAGVISASDKRGTIQTIIQQYDKLTFAQWLKDKKTNIVTLYDGNVYDPCPSNLTGIVNSCHMHSWRDHTFFSSFFAFEFYIFGFLIIAWQLFKRQLDKIDKIILIIALLSLIIWVILMYIPGSTVLHQGSYATMFLLFILIAKKLSFLPKYLFISLTALQVALFYFAWIKPFAIHFI